MNRVPSINVPIHRAASAIRDTGVPWVVFSLATRPKWKRLNASRKAGSSRRATAFVRRLV